MNSSPILEKDALEAFQEWLGDRPVLSVGPFDFPIIDRSGKIQRLDTSSASSEVESFLSATLERHGPKSLIYVCVNLNALKYDDVHLIHFINFRYPLGVYFGAPNRRRSGPCLMS